MNFSKKILIIISSIVFITACGSDDNGVNSGGGGGGVITERPALNEAVIGSWKSQCDTDNEITTVEFELKDSDYIFSYEIASHDNDDCSDSASSQQRFEAPFTYTEHDYDDIVEAFNSNVENQLIFDALQSGDVLFADEPPLSIAKGLDTMCTIANTIGTEYVVDLMNYLVDNVNSTAQTGQEIIDKITDFIDWIPLIGNIIAGIIDGIGGGLINLSQFLLTILFNDVIGNIASFTGTQIRNLCDMGIEKFYERRVISAVSVLDNNLFLASDFQICEPNNDNPNLQRWDHCVTNGVLNFDNPLIRVDTSINE